MAKIDSTTASGTQLDSNDEASSALELAKSAGEAILKTGFNSATQMVPFSKDDFIGPATDAYEWAAHGSELNDLSRNLQEDPKKALDSMKGHETSWVLRSLSDDDKSKVADAFARAGLTKKVAGESAPRGAPKPPALYEVNDRQPPAVKDFLHEQNVSAARDYAANYDAYAAREADASKRAPMANLSEPGTGASVYEEMTLARAKSPGDYVVGKLDDLQQSTRVGSQLAKLGVGDELKMSVGAELTIGAGAAGGSVDLKAKRTEDGYTLSPQLSASVSGKLNTELKAGVGASAGVEFHCKTLAEAEKVSGLLDPTRLTTLSAEDKQFLQSHVSGYDLKGSDVLKFAEDAKGLQLKSAGAKEELSAHYDREHNTLTVTSKLQGNVAEFAGTKGYLLGQKVKATTQDSAGLSGEVSVETKYQLPASVKNPGDALAALKNGDVSADSTLKLRLEKTGARGIAVEASIAGQDNVERAINTFQTRGAMALAEDLSRNPKTKSKIDLTTNVGVNRDLKLGVGDYALKLGGTSTRTHHEGHGAKLKDALAQLADD